jgi:hypothetical protein
MTDAIDEPLEVYIVRVKWTGRVVHLLWYYGEPDGVIVDSDERIVTYESREAIQKFALESGMVVSKEESANYDFDAARKWTHNPTASGIDPELFLNYWNMLDDICASVGQAVSSGVPRVDENHAYDALFRCTSAGEIVYHRASDPYFTYTDVQVMRQVLSQGLLVFASNL